MPKKYKPGLISTKRSYTIKQVCQIYADRKLNEQTVRKWIKKEGLKSFGPHNKRLIQGSDLKPFLENKNNPKKPPMAFECFKCLKCKAHSIPKDQIISITKRPNGTINATGICRLCSGKLNKIFKGGDIKRLRVFFTVKKHIVETRSDSLDTSLKTHMKNAQNKASCERVKKVLPNPVSTSLKTHMDEQQMTLF
tara:strand:+ start:812 stop:1393 length:582 start_codon:yes stop_codon:yes gene_type:complete